VAVQVRENISESKVLTDTVIGIFDPGNASPAPEASPSPWSSAVGHASTGKSGRVIERLQGDIDRLHRDKQLLKVRFEESEKANETLTTRNQYLQDRNSNYEQSHEANLRQLARKERQVEDLREELQREKARTARAEEKARAASASEEAWKDEATQSKSIAVQRESEYDTVVACRTLENDRYQGGLDKLKAKFEELLRQREVDLENQKKLGIVAEQQRQTIGQLEELNKKLNSNFKAYRSEIDKAISGMRENSSEHDLAITTKLEEMTSTTNKMKWVMNMDREFNRSKPSKDQRSR
jgi:DNA repair exonuclease SbcCD ATPase subunit